MAEERKCNDSGCTGDCSSCSKADGGIPKEPGNQYSTVKKVIGVVSGKGGVGKSLVCGMLATLMNRRGYNVGVMDADITGPSIPKAFGMKNTEVFGDDNGMIPPSTTTGIDVMSVNLLLGDETKPVD